MKKTFKSLFLVFVLVLAFIGIGRGEKKDIIGLRDITEVVEVKNGVNYIDINGDGIKDIVISGHRHNITAHSFQVYSMYINDPIQVENKIYKWQIVAINEKGKEDYTLYTIEGADCVLKDIRFIKLNRDKKYYLVVAERDLSKSFAEEDYVKFKFYELFKDDLENRYVYKKISEKQSSKKYCDVNDAFLKEIIKR